MSKSHSIGRELRGCENCGLALAPEVTYTYGFYPKIQRDGMLTCDVAPYDKRRHGPNGGETLDEAMTKAQAFLAD